MATILRNLRRRDHSWPHQTHLASHNIEQLGQLVKTHFPENCAHFGYTRIMLQLEVTLKFSFQRGVCFQKTIRVTTHGAKLERVKLPRGTYDTSAINDRPATLQDNHESNCNKQRRKGKNKKGGTKPVQAIFCAPL